jgi:hypothetical protein
MSLVVVHLRWDDVGPDEFAALCRALPEGDGRPPDCLARTLRLQGRVLHGTDVWAGYEAAERALRELPALAEGAGLAAPMTAAFALPDVYALPYRRASARPSAAAPAPVVPVPRSAGHDAVDAQEPQRAAGS